jgi:hypothetical protein
MERPLPRLLQQLYRKQFTGHFVIADQTRDESEVYLRAGAPVHVGRPVDTDRLDKVLVEYGLVAPEIVAQASAQVRDGLRLGDVLESMGALAKPKLAQVLKSQVTRKLIRLFFAVEGTYAVYQTAHNFGEGADLSLMRVDPRSVIYPGIRTAYDLPRTTRELGRLVGQRFRLANISSGFVTALGIPSEDSTVEALRKGWMTLDDLDSITSRPLEVRSIVLALYYSDSLEREVIAGSPVDSTFSLPATESSASGPVPTLGLSSDSEVAFQLELGASARPSGTMAVVTAPSAASARPSGTMAVVTAPSSTSARPSGTIPVVTAPMPAPVFAPPVPPGPALSNQPSGPSQPVSQSARLSGTIPIVIEPASAPMPARSPVTSTSTVRSSGETPSLVSPGVPIVQSPFVNPVSPESRVAAAPPQEVTPAPQLRAAPAPQVWAAPAPQVRAAPAPQVRAAPASQVGTAPVAPAKHAGVPDVSRASIEDMARKLDRCTHFEILGVGQNASADDVGKAFVRSARQFHPDRLASAGLQDLQPVAERILARINEATMVLGNATRRADYVASLSAGPQAVQHNLPTLLEAENMFLKGEVFLKKGDHAKAIEAFASACHGNSSEPQYQAYLAWTRFDDPKARKEVVVRETLKIVGGVLKERPKFARGHYWMGQLWKFLNEADKSAAAFREAVNVDSEFIEASRELRLIEMRKNKAGSKGGKPDAGRGKLAGRLFKR